MKFIYLSPFTEEHLPIYYEWAQKEHVKNTWFLEGYEPVEQIKDKLKGNGYDYPFVIHYKDLPIGFIQYCDLFAYRNLCKTPKGLFINESKGTFCIDLFIGEASYIGQGIGTKVVRLMSKKLFSEQNAKKILIDPSPENKRAIRCYEKVGFKPISEKHDGTNICLVMELKKPI